MTLPSLSDPKRWLLSLADSFVQATDIQRHRGQQSGREGARPARELTFFNVTDPAQSRSSETRKLVRTQVMKNFAKEKKRQKSEGERLSTEQTLFPAPADSIRSVQQLFSEASIGSSSVIASAIPTTESGSDLIASGARSGLVASDQGPSRPQVLPTPPNTLVSPPRAHSPSGLALPQWPLELEQSAVDLLRHCESPSYC